MRFWILLVGIVAKFEGTTYSCGYDDLTWGEQAAGLLRVVEEVQLISLSILLCLLSYVCVCVCTRLDKIMGWKEKEKKKEKEKWVCFMMVMMMMMMVANLKIELNPGEIELLVYFLRYT